MLRRCNRRVLRALSAITAALVIAASPVTNAQNLDVFTIAGSGASGYAGDGLAATDPNVRMTDPAGTFKDAATNNLYIADSLNHVIRRVDAAGTITTVAGTGVAGFSGDDGAAIAAQLDTPFAVDMDLAGNLIIADTGNNRIRRIDLVTGVITTIAGDGNTGPSLGDGGPPLEARFNQPIDLHVDSAGAIFVADRRHHVIRKIESDLSSISTVAGDSTPGFSGDGSSATSAQLLRPQGVFVDATDNIYIADTDNNVVRRVDAVTGNIDTVAGLSTGTDTVAGFAGDGGPANQARLRQPRGIHIDGSGNIYVADTYNHRVRVFTLGGNISTFAGSGPDGQLEGEFNGEGAAATESRFDFVADVFVDASGTVIISDQSNHRIRQTFPETLNAAPSDIDLDIDDLEADGSILVNASEGPGARAVRMIAIDADAGDTHVYSTVRGKGSDNNDEFSIAGTNGDILRVRNPRLSIGDLLVRVEADDQQEPLLGGATFEEPFVVTVVDDIPPEITLLGDNPFVVNLNDAYAEPGATAIDNFEESLDISADIVIDSSAVNTSQVGDYEVTYDVTDAAGLAAEQKIRTVSVVSADTTPPVITLLGDNPLLLLVGDTYADPGATAVDDVDGDISANIVVGGDVVNTNVEGSYTVTYTVSDASGNPAQVTRTVTVSAEPPASSDMGVDGSGPASIETGSTNSYTITVTNGGPDDTTGVTATIGVPTDLVSVNSVSADQGSCSVSGATVSCDLGDLANGASVDITLDVTASDSEGSGNATIEVGSNNDDGDASNNSGSVAIIVTSPAPPPPPPPPPPPSGGGGGSTGLFLLSLLALAGTRRRLTAD